MTAGARRAAIEAKRAGLIRRAADQRDTLGAALGWWAGPIALADRGIAALNIVKSHTLLLAGAMMVFAILRPRRTFRWARRGWALWQTFRWLTKKAAV